MQRANTVTQASALGVVSKKCLLQLWKSKGVGEYAYFCGVVGERTRVESPSKALRLLLPQKAKMTINLCGQEIDFHLYRSRDSAFLGTELRLL